MAQPFETQHPEIDELFDRYRRAPQGTVFAPLADACRKAGMIEEALEICRKGVEANPRYASGFVVHGKCLYDADRPGEAETAFRRVLELDAKNLVALKFIGIILSERGDNGAARACFEQILELDPDDRDIRRRLHEVGEVSAAKTTRVARVLQPSAPEPARTGESAAAKPLEAEDDGDAFEGAPITLGDESGASDEIATITLADIYAAQGYTEKALRIYREVSRRQPDNAELNRKIAAVEAHAAGSLATDAGAEDVPAGAVETTIDAAAPEATAQTPKSTPPASSAPGSRIDETRSYDQFKRWLRSVSD